MQSTIAFAPTEDNLEKGFFDSAVLSFASEHREDEESEQGEP